MGFAFVPGIPDITPEIARDIQPREHFFAASNIAHHIHHHLVQLFGGRFQILFNLAQVELVIRGFIPIGFAVKRVKIKSNFFGVSAPIRALGNTDAFHALTTKTIACSRLLAKTTATNYLADLRFYLRRFEGDRANAFGNRRIGRGAESAAVIARFVQRLCWYF